MKRVNVSLLVVGYVAVAAVAFYAGKRSEGQPSVTPVEVVADTVEHQDRVRVASATSPTQTSAPDKDVVQVEEPVDPIPLAPEFAALHAMNINIRTWHVKLERQPRDPVWASETEAAYRDFFLSNPDLAALGSNAEVTCRTSICELRVLAYGAPSDFKWGDVFWYDQNPQNSQLPAKAVNGIVHAETQNGVTAIYYLMMFRNRPDPNKDFPRGFSIPP